MRTTKTQQAQNHRLLIRTAVDLMTQHGFDDTTMKQIARTAGLGDATIYKYFPTKEKLVLAYFEQAIGDALTRMAKTKGVESFGLQERMQLLMDCVLDELLADREFVALAYQLVGRLPLSLLSDALPGKAALRVSYTEMLDAAEASGEIAPCGFKGSLAGLLADSVYAVINHWLRDTSDQFANTTQLVDMGLGVVVLTLRSGLIDKLLELGGFVLRSQLTRLLQDGSGLTSLMQLARQGLQNAATSQPKAKP
jgi:AcrR family transcriptional regulator